MSNRYLHLVRTDCPLPAGTSVVVYVRDSGGEAQDKSVPQQIEAAREYAEAHGLVVEQVYADEAKLSSNTERRDQLQAMLADLRARFKPIHDRYKREKARQEHAFGVVFWKMNRLGRDSIESTYNKTDLRMRGLTLVPLLASAETGDSGMDALIEAFQSWQDEKLLDEISENARRGLAQLVSMRDTDAEFLAHNPGWATTGGYLGIMPGGVPVGFRAERIVVGVNRRKKGRAAGEVREVQRIVPDEGGTWERAKLAWKMRHDGESLAEIHNATRLYKTTNGYTTFFANRIYTGDLEYGDAILEGFVPALIPREWWEAEQVRIRARSEKLRGKRIAREHEPRVAGAKHLLSGIVWCEAVDGECHPMHYSVKNRTEANTYAYYECSRAKGSRKERCPQGRISAKLLEAAVIDALMQRVLTVDVLRTLAAELAAGLDTRNADVATRMTALREAYLANERRLDNIVDTLADAGKSKRLLDALRAAEQEKASLELEMRRLEAMQVEDVQAVTDDDLARWVVDLRGQLERGGSDAQYALRQCVERVLVNGRTVTLEYAFYLGQRVMDLRDNHPIAKSRRITIDIDAFERVIQLSQMSESQRLARQLRATGSSYASIAAALGVNWRTARKYADPIPPDVDARA